MGFSQIKWVIPKKKPTLSADNVGFSQIKWVFPKKTHIIGFLSDEMGFSEKLTLSDQIIWVSLR